MWNHKKVAAYTGTKNLYPMMVPAVKSLLINSDVDEIWLYLEDDKLPDIFKGAPEDIINVRNASKQTYFKADGPNMQSKFTYMAMMRATFAKEFPELPRILSLDVDTIVTKDISSLWDLPLEEGDGYYFAASEEPGRSEKEDILYTNIGVCLYNLDKLRDGKCDEAIKILNEKKYTYLEQDVFNYICQGNILAMDPVYNSTIFTKVSDDPRIVHFAGEKKWSGKTIVQKYAERPWSEVMKYRKWNYGK